MENRSRSRVAAIVVICVAIVVALALVVWMILSTTSNRPVQTTNATQTSLAKTGVSVEMDGLGDDLLVGPIISLKDKEGNAVIDHLEMKGSQSLPGVRAGKYDLAVDAPAVGRDGMVYECLDPIKEIVVGDDGSVVIDLDFKQIPIDQMTPEQLQKIKDELEAAGVPVEVVTTVTNTYDPTQQPAGEAIEQQPQVTETWTYVETPQQPQQQIQPQQSQPQTHVHNWVSRTETVQTEPTYTYTPSLECNGCNRCVGSDYHYDYKNYDPPDKAEMVQYMEQHCAQTGHSGYHPSFSEAIRSLGGTTTKTYYICSGCGARQ